MIQPWQPHEDAKLRELWAAGRTDREIAALLGRSKGSCVSRRHTIKLPHRRDQDLPGTGSQRAAMDRHAAQRIATARAKGITRDKTTGKNNNPQGLTVVRLPVAQAKAGLPPPSLPPVPKWTGPTVSIAKATRQHCRYIGERPEIITAETRIFCGAQAVGASSYCQVHRPKMLRPPLR